MQENHRIARAGFDGVKRLATCHFGIDRRG